MSEAWVLMVLMKEEIDDDDILSVSLSQEAALAALAEQHGTRYQHAFIADVDLTLGVITCRAPRPAPPGIREINPFTDLCYLRSTRHRLARS